MVPDAASAVPNERPAQLRVWTNRHLDAEDRNAKYFHRLRASTMSAGPDGELLSPKAAAHVATFASNLFRITSHSKDAQHLPAALRESVIIRDEDMAIPRSQAYDTNLFEVLQAVEYRTAPTLETVTGSGYQGPAVGSMVWAKHVVTHFRDDGNHVEMVHCAGGWLPISVGNDEVTHPAFPSTCVLCRLISGS